MQFLKHIFFIILLLSLTHISWAQIEDYSDSKPGKNVPKPSVEKTEITRNNNEEVKGWDWSKARMGGVFGLQFGTFTSVELSPTFAYNVIERLQIGAGFKFIYLSQKNAFRDPNNPAITYLPFRTTMYGPSIFTRVMIWDRLFGHVEYEMINKEPFYSIDRNQRINVHHLLLGGGYALQMGNAGDMYITILLDVINSRESIYRGNFGIGRIPVILKLGFGFGAGGRRNR
jgi:hypothetical protein